MRERVDLQQLNNGSAACKDSQIIRAPWSELACTATNKQATQLTCGPSIFQPPSPCCCMQYPAPTGAPRRAPGAGAAGNTKREQVGVGRMRQCHRDARAAAVARAARSRWSTGCTSPHLGSWHIRDGFPDAGDQQPVAPARGRGGEAHQQHRSRHRRRIQLGSGGGGEERLAAAIAARPVSSTPRAARKAQQGCQAAGSSRSRTWRGALAGWPPYCCWTL